MNADTVDQIAIMKKLVIMEKEIFNSIMNKETKYYKPDKISAMNAYANPMSINGIKAAVIYNSLKDEDWPSINLEETNKIIKVPLDLNDTALSIIKDKYPQVYEKIVVLQQNPNINAIDVIGFPTDAIIPDWVLELVDFNGIINSNLKNFPIESIGLNMLNNDSVNFSNIIQL